MAIDSLHDTGAGPRVPRTLRRIDGARERYGAFADAYVEGLWRGDPLADAYVGEFRELGHARGMEMLQTACREGIDAVPEAPESLRALFAQLETVPEWLDVPAIEQGSRYVARYSQTSGIVLGAASLVSGYANSAASRPLEMTGRLIESAGARTMEVGTWLVEVNRAGGLDRYSVGFELTVRVRIIHALVRTHMLRRDDWDLEAWGVPVCQAYLAYTLVEFGLIPLRAIARIGTPYLPHEETAAYARWRYLGHLLGIDEALLPTDAAEHERLESIYLMTRPEVDDYCRALVAGVNHDFLVPEVRGILPKPLHRHAPTVVHALERLFLGDEVADDLQLPPTRLVGVIAAYGAASAVFHRVLDRITPTLAPRARRGVAFRDEQEVRMRRDWGVQHDLVDASPSGGRPHPARGDM